MMPSRYWIKLYHEVLHDPKMGRLPDHLWRRCIELFLLAGEHAPDGTLPDVADMAWILRTDAESLAVDLCALEKYNIVHAIDGAWAVTHFVERQNADTGGERIARYRDRKRKAEYSGNALCDVTSNEMSNDVVTNRYTDKDIDKDKDKEEIAAVAPPAPTPDPPKRASGHADPRTSHPAILAVKRLTGQNPNRGLYDRFIKILGETPDEPRLKQCLEAWLLKGYKPVNYAWLTEWYAKGIPNGNGHAPSRASPQANDAWANADVAAIIESNAIKERHV